MIDVARIALAISAALALRAGAAAQTRYVCPPCGADCHGTVFARPGTCGTCGTCGMKLVDQEAVPYVAVLVAGLIYCRNSVGRLVCRDHRP